MTGLGKRTQYRRPSIFELSPHLLPILIRAAKLRADLDLCPARLRTQNRIWARTQGTKTLYGGAICVIGFAQEDLQEALGEQIPPINTLVVNASTKTPGECVDVFLKNYLGIDKGELEPNGRKGLLQTALEHVYAYPHWDRVLAHFGSQLLAPETTLIPQGPIALPAMLNHTGAVESDSHKDLKRYVADNPFLVSAYGRFPNGVNEHPLRSGDRLDVFFHNASAMLAVEIKPADAPEPEIIRGVFQVVKYCAVLKAEQLIAGRLPTAQAILALANKPSVKIRQIAGRLAVHILVVDL